MFFPYFFISVLCARLSWPSRQVLSARKYTISYCSSQLFLCYDTVWRRSCQYIAGDRERTMHTDRYEQTSRETDHPAAAAWTRAGALSSQSTS